MALSEVASGTQAATISTEHTLGAAITTAGVYALLVDCNALVAGDTLELRAYSKVLGASTERQCYLATLSGAQADPDLISVPVPTAHSVKFTLKQTAGTGRSFDWSVVKF